MRSEKVYVVFIALDYPRALEDVIKIFSSKERAENFASLGTCFFQKLKQVRTTEFYDHCREVKRNSALDWDSIVMDELKKRIPEEYYVYYDIAISKEFFVYNAYTQVLEKEVE